MRYRRYLHPRCSTAPRFRHEKAVQEILERIEQLSEEDRLILEERLAERAEAEWKREAEAARRIARERGIDQAAIDQAIHDVRYSS
jgi:hypothetical protein